MSPDLKIRYLEGYDPTWGELGYAHPEDAGFDLRYAPKDGAKLYLKAGVPAIAALGVAFDVPKGFELQIRGRSGLAFKHNVYLPHAPGTIDAGFRGEIKAILIYYGTLSRYVVTPGDRICQAVLAPIAKACFCPVGEFDGHSDRGVNGFGSSGYS